VTVRLRHVAAINPSTPEFELVPDTAELPFLPLEAVWPGDRLDTTRRQPKAAVSSGYTRFREGDILLPKITPTFQADRTVIAIGLEGGVGAGTTELHVVRAGSDADVRYLRYLLSSKKFLDEGEASMIGVAGQKRVPDDYLRDLPVPVVDLRRQRAIADYLDRETARIDALIEKKQRMVELLEERFDAQLMDAVLGGTECSGPPWTLGIGADRALTRIGAVLRIRGEKNDPITQTQVLSLTAARGVILYEDKGDIGNKASEDISRYSLVRVGDIVVNSMNVIIGSVGLSRYEGALSPVYYVLCPINEEHVDRRFLEFHFRIRPFQRQLGRLGYGILEHRLRIPWINLKAQDLALPPLDVQRQVADCLEESERETVRQRALLLRSIDLLTERRQALITAAVTGELEIPGVAA
jgi:type I restriction enzyme S subunit